MCYCSPHCHRCVLVSNPNELLHVPGIYTEEALCSETLSLRSGAVCNLAMHGQRLVCRATHKGL